MFFCNYSFPDVKISEWVHCAEEKYAVIYIGTESLLLLHSILKTRSIPLQAYEQKFNIVIFYRKSFFSPTLFRTFFLIFLIWQRSTGRPRFWLSHAPQEVRRRSRGCRAPWIAWQRWMRENWDRGARRRLQGLFEPPVFSLGLFV